VLEKIANDNLVYQKFGSPAKIPRRFPENLSVSLGGQLRSPGDTKFGFL
jgi:hypothetical protein